MQKLLLSGIVAAGMVLHATGSFALLPVRAIELAPPDIKPVTARELSPSYLVPVAAHELTPIAAIELAPPSNEPEAQRQTRPYEIANIGAPVSKRPLSLPSANTQVTESVSRPVQEIPKQTAAPSDYNPAVY